MKSFVFPLERVRQWRASQVGIEESHLRRLVSDRRRLELERDELENSVQAAANHLVHAATVDASELVALDAYRRYARQSGREFDARIDESAGAIEAQRAHVLEARRKAKLLERLKSRRFQEWRAAVDAEQESIAAELFLARTVRIAAAAAITAQTGPERQASCRQ